MSTSYIYYHRRALRCSSAVLGHSGEHISRLKVLPFSSRSCDTNLRKRTRPMRIDFSLPWATGCHMPLTSRNVPAVTSETRNASGRVYGKIELELSVRARDAVRCENERTDGGWTSPCFSYTLRDSVIRTEAPQRRNTGPKFKRAARTESHRCD